MREISKLSKGEKLAYRLALIDDSVSMIKEDIDMNGKLDADTKYLIKDNFKGLKLLKKGKGYIFG